MAGARNYAATSQSSGQTNGSHPPPPIKRAEVTYQTSGSHISTECGSPSAATYQTGGSHLSTMQALHVRGALPECRAYAAGILYQNQLTSNSTSRVPSEHIARTGRPPALARGEQMQRGRRRGRGRSLTRRGYIASGERRRRPGGGRAEGEGEVEGEVRRRRGLRRGLRRGVGREIGAAGGGGQR